MSVYKEGYKAIAEIQQNERQVYKDASDFGAVTKKDDAIWNLAKNLVKDYGLNGTRKESRYSTGRSVTTHVQLMDEWAVSDGTKSINEATEIYLVVFVSCSDIQGADGYIHIEKID